ncbi:mobilization protein [Pokkaliibacter sp. MBI-7]|uniref:mobilization protein n=1 Tax=Pokkaliibacter sp. MBI-7 TaxID=3040600 RepID=UPI00244C0A22|nr:mobilization protein [Pokkaliibacter sp. MBI-7]MDH2436833.1 mobilization protein [Pokkaliibacter sp. MBI-7]
MSLGEPVKVRFTLEKQLMMEDEAARVGKPLSTYIREYVEEAHDTGDQITGLRREVSALRHLVEDLAENGIVSGGSDRGMSASDRAALVETLLLLRHISKPEHRKEVRAEMRRNGIELWDPEGKED